LVSLASIDSFYFNNQILWFVLGFVVIFFGSQINWPWLLKQSGFRHGFYWFSVSLLLIPFLQPGLIRGADRLISFGGFYFQPSEIVKIALLIFLAGFFSRRHVAAWQNKNILISFIYALVPVLIVMNQPDLGSAIAVGSIWLGFLLMSGINKKKFLVGLVIFLLMIAIMWLFVLHPYQKDRVLSFIFPEIDPLGTSYNVIQSKIAIGSAGFWGKGFGMGTQVQFGFLPESHNDFIFAAFVEEWGIFGGVILLLTYSLLILRIVSTGLKARSNDLKFLILGIGLIFLMHMSLNIGSATGLLPVTGINLLFVSYGGSNLLTSSILISIMERIRIESTS
ncbi:MAG: FtsW/RodA/SpoVE family cell cycle protein, partial [Candidatus Paceibacterota bacterium]